MTEKLYKLRPIEGGAPITDEEGHLRILDGAGIPEGYEIVLCPAGDFEQIRCPKCDRLACEAQRGSVVRVKCVRCGETYEQEAAASRTSSSDD